MDERRKKKHQYAADFYGTYGAPFWLSYEQWFGLFLNIGRVEQRRGFVAVTAIISGLSGSIPKSFWEGVSHTEAEAEYSAQRFEDRKAFYERTNGGAHG